MGSSASKEVSPTAAPIDAQTPSSEPVKQEAKSTEQTSSSGCPVKHGGSFSLGWPGRKKHDAAVAAARSSSEGGCPVKISGKEQQHPQYNVYSQPIDPTNQMPAVANQLPSPGQSKELPTHRVASTIPKGGTEDGTTWTYPSPQMFYNALSRKGKLGDTKEDDVVSVVALHNNMNERTWNKVKEWEEVLSNDDEPPKLLKFMGRPSDLSPKARFKHWLGHPLPFDRHDWTVLRKDGTTVRYVIDYYHDDSRALEGEGTGMPGLHEGEEATPSLLVDVRPALDGPQQLLDRTIRMPYARHVAGSTKFEPFPMMPSGEMKTQVKESLEVWDSIQKAAKEKQERQLKKNTTQRMHVSEKEAVALAKAFAHALKDCKEAQNKVNKCSSDEECAQASMDLTLCFGKVLCPLQHASMVKALSEEGNEKEYEARVEAALENLQTCVATKTKRYAHAQRVHPPKIFH